MPSAMTKSNRKANRRGQITRKAAGRLSRKKPSRHDMNELTGLSEKASRKGAGTTDKMWEREERSSLATRRTSDPC